MGVQAGKGPQSTAPATKSALQGPHKVLHLPPFLKTNHMYLSRHQSTSKISTMSKVHAPATKSTSKQNRSDPLRACHEKVDFGHQNEVSLAPATQVTTVPKNAHGATTRVQSRQAPAATTQILRACAVDMHFEGSRGMNCTVNSNEVAKRPDATLRCNTGL